MESLIGVRILKVPVVVKTGCSIYESPRMREKYELVNYLTVTVS